MTDEIVAKEVWLVENLASGALGICTICGTRGAMIRGSHASVREGFPCPECRATLRYRDQAALILDEFGHGQFLSLAQLVRSKRLDSVAIYEPALGGPFVKLFAKLPNYRRSYYWDGARPGDVRNGVPFEDLKQLSFPDASLDLVLTSDVFEHILDPMAAHQEIARVLKVGGIHVFSIPTSWPLPDTSVSRVRVVDDDIEHALPARFHTAGDGSPSLVVTDFGADLVSDLRSFNLATQIVRRSLPMDIAYQNATFVSRRLA